MNSMRACRDMEARVSWNSTILMYSQPLKDIFSAETILRHRLLYKSNVAGYHLKILISSGCFEFQYWLLSFKLEIIIEDFWAGRQALLVVWYAGIVYIEYTDLKRYLLKISPVSSADLLVIALFGEETLLNIKLHEHDKPKISDNVK